MSEITVDVEATAMEGSDPKLWVCGSFLNVINGSGCRRADGIENVERKRASDETWYVPTDGAERAVLTYIRVKYQFHCYKSLPDANIPRSYMKRTEWEEEVQ